MEERNLIFAGFWVFAGLVTGMVHGLWFHRENWMGGYGSWRRRLARLGHIAFLGTGMLNFAFAFSVRLFDLEGRMLPWIGGLLIVGAVTMPTVCYLAAWRQTLRLLFVIPVASLIAGVGMLAYLLAANTGGGSGGMP